jgi:hypothetical protein
LESVAKTSSNIISNLVWNLKQTLFLGSDAHFRGRILRQGASKENLSGTLTRVLRKEGPDKYRRVALAFQRCGLLMKLINSWNSQVEELKVTQQKSFNITMN